MATNDDIREYWQKRSLEADASPSATTQDVYLRELEISTFTKRLLGLNLPDGATATDIGCGDGYSTLRIAESVKGIFFRGMDFSSNMVGVARSRLEQNAELKKRVSFEIGDVTKLRGLLESDSCEVAMTDRCLINLISSEQQYDALKEIHRALKPGGHYLGIENFEEGNDAFNAVREAMGLKKIPVRWHNLFFKQEEFVANMRSLFKNVEIDDFSSSYYFASRIVYSKYCQMKGIEPDYLHEMHQLAVDLPPFGNLSPIKLILMEK